MNPLATRPLGRTGHDVTILALGGVCYNFLPDTEAAAVVHRALDLGVNYIDTAYSYKESERKIGPVMAERRSDCFLATKTIKRDAAGARAEIEESFERLRTDVIDCVQIHDLHTEEQLAEVTGTDGALRAIEPFLKDGSVRFVGVTSHRSPDVLAKAMQAYPFDTLLVALGPMHAAVRPLYDTVMPVARERGVGVLAMKALAYGWLADHAAHALRFVMGREGVSAAVVGADTIEQVEANVAVARDFTPLGADEERELLSTAEAMYRERCEKAWFIAR